MICNKLDSEKPNSEDTPLTRICQYALQDLLSSSSFLTVEREAILCFKIFFIIIFAFI